MTYSELKNSPKSKNNKEVKKSIPAFLVGIDEKPFDFIPDAEMPDKLIKLYEREKDELRNKNQ